MGSNFQKTHMADDVIENYKKGDLTINQMKDNIKEIINKVDIDLKNMDRDDRIKRMSNLLKELQEEYISTCSGTHNVFIVDISGVKDIIDNYKDVLFASDVFMSNSNISQTIRGFKDIHYGERWLGLEWNYEKCENGNLKIKLTEVDKIEVNISCETILSFSFFENDKEILMISFREMGR